MRGGGAERSLADLMNEMCRRGHDVTLVVREPEAFIEARPFYELHPAIRRYNLCRWAPAPPDRSDKTGKRPLGRLHSRLLHSLRKRLSAVPLRDVLNDLTPDLAVVFLISHFTFVHRSMGDLHVPLVLCHRNDPVAKLEELAAKRSRRLNGLDAAHARAALVTVQMQAYRYGLPPEVQEKTVVIPNAINVPSGSIASPLQEKEKRILNVGRLSPVKNQRLLIRAFASLAPQFPDWSVEIYGDGPERDVLQSLITTSGLEGRVHLKGTVTNIDKAYRHASIFAFPSYYEGFSRALAEAMAHGLPSVCLTHCIFSREMIEESGGGLLATDELASYAVALEAMMSSDKLRRKTGTMARTHIAAFSHQAIYDLWEEAFERARSGAPTLM